MVAPARNSCGHRHFCRTGSFHRTRSVRCDRRVIDPADVREVDGIALTSPVRTILDLASQLPLIDLVVVMDSALKKRTCTVEQLRARAYDRGVRGITRYRRALELSDGRSESPMETLMRLLIVSSGLPTPTPQVNAFDDFGAFVARMDLGPTKSGPPLSTTAAVTTSP